MRTLEAPTGGAVPLAGVTLCNEQVSSQTLPDRCPLPLCSRDQP